MMFSLIYLIFTIFLTVRISQYFRKHMRLRKYIDKINGPTALPIIGHLHMAFCTPAEIIRKIIGISTLFKSPSKIWLLNQPLVGVSSPEDVQVVTSKCLEKHELFRSMSVLIGDGLITANGEKWKRSRSIVGSSFNLSTMSKNFLDIFNSHNSRLMEKFENLANATDETDLWPYVFKAFYDLISETAMGHAKGIDDEEFTNNRENFQNSSQWCCNSLLYIIKIGFRRLKSVSTYISSIRSTMVMASIFIQNISLSNWTLPYNIGLSKFTSEKNSFTNLVDALLNIKERCNRFTDQEIIDEILTIQFAGSETTALNTCFTLLMLAAHMDSQEKVHEELHRVFGDDDRPPTLEDLAALTFLDQCIKETMRRFTVAPLSMRVASEDITLPNRTVIPAGSNIVPMYFLVHLDRKLYPNPEAWNPYNFDPDQVAKRPAGSFVPFGAGPRMCVGYKYATLAMKALISTILRRFKITTSLAEEDLIISVDILARCTNGFPIKFHYL